MIIINGRIHKAHWKEFIQQESAPTLPLTPPKPAMLANFVAYKTQEGHTRVGHLDQDTALIQPLALPSGAPIQNLFQVIEVGAETLIPNSADKVTLESVSLLPPLSGRDILCVGKNYAEHAKEFNKSGYDASDKVDQPTHPVIFTKV